MALEASAARATVSNEAERTERIDRLRHIISDDVGEPIILEVEIIPLDIIRVRSGPAPE